MPVNQSPSWFHVDFISLAPALPLQHLVTCNFSFSLPKMLRAAMTADLIIVCETARTFKCKLTNVQHLKPCAVWPLISFSGINRVCGHHFGWSLQTQSHFRGLSLSPPQPQPQQQQQQQQWERDWEVFMWLTLQASYRECTLHSHAPWDPPRRGLCKCLIWNDSDIFQESAKSCNGALQFYF